eukprot:1159247-Pelagomonas_calceolata.AAC.4
MRRKETLWANLTSYALSRAIRRLWRSQAPMQGSFGSCTIRRATLSKWVPLFWCGLPLALLPSSTNPLYPILFNNQLYLGA